MLSPGANCIDECEVVISPLELVMLVKSNVSQPELLSNTESCDRNPVKVVPKFIQLVLLARIAVPDTSSLKGKVLPSKAVSFEEVGGISINKNHIAVSIR